MPSITMWYRVTASTNASVSSGSEESRSVRCPSISSKSRPKLSLRCWEVSVSISLRPVGLEDAHLAVEALEEADVAGLVGDLGAEENFLVLGRGGPHDRPQLLGDLLLADEERREAIHPLEALFLTDPLVPVLAVPGEVELLRLPLLALPEPVELLVGEQLDVGGAVGLLHQRRIGGRLEVLALGAWLGPGRLFGLHLHSPSSSVGVWI